MRERPNLAERLLAYFGFALAVPTMAPVALLAGALARVQKSNRVVRAVLTPMLGAAVFVAFVITVIVFIPYYVLLWIGGTLRIVDVRVPRHVAIGEVAHDETFASLAVDCSMPHDDTTFAVSVLTAFVRAIANGKDVQFYRSPPYSKEIFGPFATSPYDIGARIASFVESVSYSTSANCWFLLAPADTADLLAIAETWDAARVDAVLDRASMLCHVETMVDQGSHNSRVVVYRRDAAEVTADRARLAGVTPET